MIKCIKCAAELPDGAVFCHVCGKKQVHQSRSAAKRGNGEGSVYRRGKYWEAAVVLGYKIEDGRAVPIRRTKRGFRSKKEALEHLPSLRKEKTRKVPTLFDLWIRFSGSKTFDKLSASRKEKYGIAWRKIEKETLIPVDQMTVTDLQNIVDHHARTYYPARDIKDLLSKLYQLAMPDRYVDVNLAEYIELPDRNSKERQAFDKDDIAKLWGDYLDNNIFSGYILLMIYTGMMPSELLGLQKANIDWDHKVIRGAGKKTKVRKETPIVLADIILPVLEHLCEQSKGDKVLHINKDRFYSEYYTTLSRAGCKRLSPYSARHTTASALALENINPNIIQRIMRHARFSTTEGYIHIDIEPVLNAVNRLKKPE